MLPKKQDKKTKKKIFEAVPTAVAVNEVPVVCSC
jgi:hypothetical protein